jgi:serine/threonine-protein kinase
MHTQALSTGSVIDRYTVEGVLGEGGMAIVYRVRHNVLGTRHALKILTIGNSEVQRRLKQEGMLQAQLQHPNIVTVTDVLEIGGAPALVMEFVDGPPLDQLLRQTRLTLPQADSLARGILDGVGHAHDQGLVHRDLKPGNIILKVAQSGFVPKVADFGLAKVVEGGGMSKTRTGSTMGTPHYMSPEQIRDAKNVGPASDVFALGAILYELVTGHRAFEGEDLLTIFNAVASGQYTHPTVYAPDLPPHMLAAIEQALRVDPAARPPTVAALKALWTGGADPALSIPPAVFDAAFLQSSRTLGGGATEPARPTSETWSSRVQGPPPGTESLVPASGPPRSVGSSSPAVMAAGVGGLVLGSIGLGAALLAVLLAGGVWWWASRPGEAVADEPRPAPSIVAAPSEPSPDPLAPVPDVVPPVPGEAPPPPGPRPTGGQTTAPVAPGAAPEPVAPPAPTGEVADVEPPSEVAPEPEPATPQPAEQPRNANAEVPEWTQFLASPDPAERRRGVANLRNRTDDESVRLLIRVLREETEPAVRLDAVRALVWRADESRGDFGLLMSGLVVGSALSEVEALASVGALGRRTERPEQLRKGFIHLSPRVRTAALEAAVTMAPRAPDGFDWHPLLDPLATDQDPGVAKKAKAALATLAP